MNAKAAKARPINNKMFGAEECVGRFSKHQENFLDEKSSISIVQNFQVNAN